MGEPVSYLLLLPKTGRTHQLRIHCSAALGHSIVGDCAYAYRPFDSSELAGETRWCYPTQTPNHDVSLDHQIKRTLLHAYRLRIRSDTNIKENDENPLECENLDFKTKGNPFYKELYGPNTQYIVHKTFCTVDQY